MATAIIMPKLGLTMESGTLVAWHKGPGDAVQQGELIAEIETDKITSEVETPVDGTVLKLLAEVGQEIAVLAPIAIIGQSGEDITAYLPAGAGAAPMAASAVVAGTAPSPAASAIQPDSDRVRATPRARKLIAERGLDLAVFAALGKTRITEDDVLAYLEGQAPPSPAAEPLTPLTNLQKVTAQRLTQSFRDVPQFSLRFCVEMRRALEVQQAASARLARKVSINDVILRGLTLALGRHPLIQQQYTEQGMRRPAHINLGVAVATEQGLLVPVIHDAGALDLDPLSQAAAALVEKARRGRLGLDEISGGTFTVSNLGMFGITSFVPIVNLGESAILGVGAMQQVARFDETLGIVANVPMIEFTLVCDHRAVDGAMAAQFCQMFKQVLEQEEIT